ncbi:hypothetical protein ABL78_6471 [Leptomonas seymouri]|uniref:Uncharacterized protein n=1 Tax=Leptomonas seymouri TaxID=5684 RepID=A0A0N1PAC7_LEPSE|nr:hypothetical protein ABL78_6471 [Leptomonas seymouri]|eukprot:KPI84483.1 hypothetical protein ABL78_6471 [Leptomonas seymouri]
MPLRSFVVTPRQHLRFALLRYPSRSLGHPVGRTWTQLRCTSVLTPPTPPAAPTPPPRKLADTDVSVRSSHQLPHDSFTKSFQLAVYAVAGTRDENGLQGQHLPAPSASSSSPQLSPWLQYLVGLRDDPPVANANASTRQLYRHRRPSHEAPSRFSTPILDPDSVFLHHVFSNAKEAVLHVSVRQPESFLRPQSATAHTHDHLRLTDGAVDEGSLVSFGGVLSRLEAALHAMARRELAAKSEERSMERIQDAPWKERFLLLFWRAMLEQAFLTQYCEVGALETTASQAKQAHTLHTRTVYDLYPFDYREQPSELRWRLEQGIRTLLCVSAFTLHAQWERYMTRHGPSNRLAQVLGLEFILLWWYANPDQVPVELTSSAHRLPPCTLRRQQRLNDSGNTDGTPSRSTVLGAAMAAHNVVPMEHHLREYMAMHFFSNASANAHLTHNTCLANGGFLCPAAVFPPSYQDALRAHLRQVRHRKNLITCPLFPRVLEVAIAVASTSPPNWGDDAPAAEVSRHATRSGPADDVSALRRQQHGMQTASRRGCEIAKHLVVDWLWPIVTRNRQSDVPAASSTLSVHELLHPAVRSASATQSPPSLLDHAPMTSSSVSEDSSAEKTEDWAVLVAAITAVAHLRGHLPALRRGNRANRRASRAAAVATTGGSNTAEKSEDAESVAYIRDELYTPAMRALLCAPARREVRKGTLGEEPPANGDAVLPRWTYLVFAHVAFCFEDCGWLRCSVAHQPATPARLWGQLYQALCDAFPNVFHAGNIVTVLWTLWAIEGAASKPSTYYSAFQLPSKGIVEAVQAWADALASTQTSLSCAGISKGTSSSRLIEEQEEALAGSWAIPDGSHQCPRAERCQRSAYLASASSGGSAQAQPEALSSIASGGHASPHSSRRSARRGSRWGDAQVNCPSFASPCPCSPPPVHGGSFEARRQMLSYLNACKELREEVGNVVVHIFRRYATLPILRATSAEGNTHDSGVTPTVPSPEEVARLHRMGQPSLLVLLKLLHSLAVLGDTLTWGSCGKASDCATAAGLVPSVLQDVVAACSPGVASYLRRMQVYSASMSGKDGALALLFDDDLQSQLNNLAPQLGRRRLVVALLWSGLPASALRGLRQAGAGERSEARGFATDTAFGSGSLAWRVLDSNQIHFFTTLPTSASPPSSNSAPPQALDSVGEDKARAAPLSPNTPTNVFGILEEVLKHMLQLAITEPEPARVMLNLQPHLCAYASTTSQETGYAGRQNEAKAGTEADLAAHERDVEVDTAVDSYAGHDVAYDDFYAEAEVGAETEEETRSATRLGSLREAEEDEGFCLPSNWENEATGESADANDSAHLVMSETPSASEMLEFPREGEGPSTRWSSHETLWLSETAPRPTTAGPPTPTDIEGQEQREVKFQHRKMAAEEVLARRRAAVVAALQPASPSSQHLFFSILEVLAWVANAQQSREELAAVTEERDGQSKASVADRVGGAPWCAQLATCYNICATVWATRAGVRHDIDRSMRGSGSTAANKAAVLCWPKLMEQVILLFSLTCPDAYLLSLLLLNLVLRGTEGPVTSSAIQTSLTYRWQRAVSLFPWSVECALAQLLFHAGVSSTTVLRWRSSFANSTETDPSGMDTHTVLAHVKLHHILLNSLSAPGAYGDGRLTSCSEYKNRESAAPLAVGPSTDVHPTACCHQHEATAHDLVMSIGSLLLCSLHLRLRNSGGKRSIGRHNVYVNEFLLNVFSDPSDASNTEMTTLRAVLPSVQVKSSSLFVAPPQQLVPLRQAWRDRMDGVQRDIIRCNFRGSRKESAFVNCCEDSGSSTRTAQLSSTQSATPGEIEQAYVDAFL